MTKRHLLFLRYWRRQKLIIKLFLVTIIVFLFLFLTTLTIFSWYAKDLPSLGKIQRNSGFSTVFFDREGKIIYQMYKDQNRIPVSLKDIPADLKNATVAIEDKNFYRHQGFAVSGLLRAVFNIVFRGQLQGGSTLTQQLVKNTLLSSERTLSRKIKEFILSIEIERRYTKDQILEMYLNEAPYGGTFWGVEAAARGYFGKSVKDLTLAECAFLAGLPQRPSYYSPFIGKNKAYLYRTKDVLRRMREDGYIKKSQEENAYKEVEKMEFKAPKISFSAPHFIFYVRDQIVEMFGEKALDQGWQIKTTLSLDIQKKAEEIVKEEIKKLVSLNVTNGGVIVLDTQTAEILAMVGSVDYNNEKFGKYNVTLAYRQPGSALKPITYAVAFEKGYTPATVIMDLPTVFPSQGGQDYKPENYDGKYRGPVQLRFALGNSLNIPAVKLLAMIGIREFLNKAYLMGLDSLAPTPKNLSRFGLSLTLGGGETRLIDLTSAFSIFGRGGTKIKPIAILEIRDRKGKIIYQKEKQKEKQVISQEVAFLISHILSDNNARKMVFGSQSLLQIPGKTVAVKTGTTDDKRDNWTIGYTVSATVGVWVGNNDNSPMSPKIASGLSGAASIWNQIFRYLFQKGFRDGIIEKPEKVIAQEIDAFLGGLPKEGFPKRAEYFIKGTEPKTVSPFYKKLKISKTSGKLANELEIKLGDYEEKEYIVITEEDPVSSDGINRWQQAIDEWRLKQEDERFKYPTETSEIKSEEVIIQIKEPSDNAKLETNTFNLRVKILSIYPLKNIEIFIGDTLIKRYQEDKKEIEEIITLSNGVYEIKIKAENEKGKTAETKIKVNLLGPSPTQE